jgi:2-oxoglutarate dehydrogenase E2 component (dihydrolipoamide succinyltransferase)
MQVEVVMPKMGESIQEGKILRWAKKVGEKISKDETILEISTDKVDSEIPSPVAGVLATIVVQEGDTVPVGTVIAMVETDASAKIEAKTAPVVTLQETASPAMQLAVGGAVAVLPSAPVVARGSGNRFYSPLVRSIAKSERISIAELDSLSGSGAGGRVNKQDLLNYLKNRVGGFSPVRAENYSIHKADLAELQKKYPSARYEILQMENLQQKMAEHMVRSLATSPHAHAIDEIDMTAIVKFRERNAARFEQELGFKLTFTPFILSAVTKALLEYPLVNSSVEGDKIIVKKYINLGMAVASSYGLIVPNIKNAEAKDFVAMARAVNDITQRTRTKKLKPEEIQDGTFTVTNYGVFGNIIGIPIINQPQVAILGTGAIKKRPIVLTDADGNDTIAIRSMCYFTHSFDHRILDGAISGQFLARVKTEIEQPNLRNMF